MGGLATGPPIPPTFVAFRGTRGAPQFSRPGRSSVTDEGRLTLANDRAALSRRLYLEALWNSLILGAWTAVLSVAIGLPMAWAVGRSNDCHVTLDDGARVRVQAEPGAMLDVGQRVVVRLDARACTVFYD
jgi:hypothetical protein